MNKNKEENPRKGKSVYFNTEIPFEKDLHEYSKKVKNFSNYVKKLMFDDMVNKNREVDNPYGLGYGSFVEEPQPVVRSRKVAAPIKSPSSLQPKDEATQRELESYEKELNSQKVQEDEVSPQTKVQHEEISQNEEEHVEEKNTDNEAKPLHGRGSGGLAAGGSARSRNRKNSMWPDQ